MKNFYLNLCLILISVAIVSCEKSSDEVTESEKLSISEQFEMEAIPLQVIRIPITDPPGVKEDYSLFFGAEEVPVSAISSNAIEFIVPLDAQRGKTEVEMVYEENAYLLGNLKIVDHKDFFPADLVYMETEVEEYPVIFIDSANTVILPRVINDRLDEISLQLEDGTLTHVELNEMGLPEHVSNEKIDLVFDGYDFDNATVNVGYYFNNEISEAKYEYGIPIDPETLDFFKNNEDQFKGPVRDRVLETLGMSLSVVGCAASVLTIPTGIGILGTVVSCGSAIYDVAKYYDPSLTNEFADIMAAGYGVKMNMIGCLKIVGKPTGRQLYDAIKGCSDLAIQAAKGISALYDTYVAQTERELRQLQRILNTGFGDIKITLSWDTATDIDLWVTDPFYEQIWYGSTRSSSGGELDMDNTDGYGPENIYWPANEAPFGTYTVQVHYFGPEDGPVTNCKVEIKNFGQDSTYNFSLTPDGLVTVAIFEAGVNTSARPEQQKLVYEVEDSNLLPPKE